MYFQSVLKTKGGIAQEILNGLGHIGFHLVAISEDNQIQITLCALRVSAVKTIFLLLDQFLGFEKLSDDLFYILGFSLLGVLR